MLPRSSQLAWLLLSRPFSSTERSHQLIPNWVPLKPLVKCLVHGCMGAWMDGCFMHLVRPTKTTYLGSLSLIHFSEKFYKARILEAQSLKESRVHLFQSSVWYRNLLDNLLFLEKSFSIINIKEGGRISQVALGKSSIVGLHIQYV